jgi:hypothetical protein
MELMELFEECDLPDEPTLYPPLESVSRGASVACNMMNFFEPRVSLNLAL